MAIPSRVQAGDLIAADDWNLIVATLEDMLARLIALEGGGTGVGLAIVGLSPASGPYQIGTTLTVLGRGFDFFTGGARVFLNGVRVLTFDAGSSDTQLIFTIPSVPGVAEPGTPVTLLVTNGAGQEATRDIVLRPAPIVLFGDVDVVWLSLNPTTIVPDAPVTFQFRITSRASASAAFLIDPIIAVAANQSVWQSRMQVLDAALNPLSGRLVQLAPSQQQIIHVRINPVPSGTNGVDFQLNVSAGSGGVTGTSGALPFEVGTTAEPPDTSISLSPTAVIGQGTLLGDTLTMAASRSVRARFLVTFSQVGTYDLTIDAPAAGTGWTATRFATTPAQYIIQAGDLVGGIATRFPEVQVQTGATPNASASVQVSYRRQGATNRRAFALNLSLQS